VVVTVVQAAAVANAARIAIGSKKRKVKVESDIRTGYEPAIMPGSVGFLDANPWRLGGIIE